MDKGLTTFMVKVANQCLTAIAKYERKTNKRKVTFLFSLKNSYSKYSRGRAPYKPNRSHAGQVPREQLPLETHQEAQRGKIPLLIIPLILNYYTYANAHAHAVFYFHAHAHEYAHANSDLCSALSYGGKLAAFMPSAWLRLPIKGMREQERNKNTSKEVSKIGIKHLTPLFNLW